MANYIDGFSFPILEKHLDRYKEVAHSVGKIWKEHGALAYYEFVGEDLKKLEGTKSFPDVVEAKEGETIIFGWVIFENREARDVANKRVATDTRMGDLIAPLVDPKDVIFDAGRMVFGGFQSFVEVE